MKLVHTVRAVIFDLFHTLTDLESKWSRIPPTSKMLGVPEQAWSDQLLLHSEQRLTGEWRDPFQILRTMALAIDPSISDATIRAVVGRRIRRMQEFRADRIEEFTRQANDRVEHMGELLLLED
jgi:FMN phosphatase YigB (HAD superfamily)